MLARSTFVALLMTSACSLYNGESTGAPDAYVSDSASEWLHQVMPMLEAQCGVCHAGTTQAVGFLAGNTPDEVRTTLLTYNPPVVDLEDPPASRILLKGAHEGPPLTTEDQAVMINWLEGN